MTKIKLVISYTLSIFAMIAKIMVLDLLCHKLSPPVLNLINLEVVSLSESPHLGHDVINVILIGLDIIFQQL